MSAPRTEVVVVTGLSGAGKTTALHTLEDLGFFCVDNLPTVLAPQAVKACEAGGITRIALGIDVRVRAFLSALGPVLADIAGSEDGQATRDLQVLFLDAADEAILRRFSESRRPHPLAAHQSDAVAVLDGVRVERERLAPIRARATHVFDTTHLSVHELRRALIAQLGPASVGAPRMLTRILSFGFKYGMPADADLVLDVRFLENPYFVPELKNLPGTDEKVAKFVLALPEAQEFLEKTRDLLTFMMPKYEREGKSYLTIGIGCTGGRHRSVALADALADALAKEVTNHVQGSGVGVGVGSAPPASASPTSPVIVVHRDVERGERISTTELKGVLGGGRP